MQIRPALPVDRDAIWTIVGPTFKAGDTHTNDPSTSKDEALEFWFAPDRETFVATADDGTILGTYYLRANQSGAGSHVANCGYMTGQAATGQGVGRAMCAHSLETARERGFRAMQFNFVVSTNTRAVALWEAMGFEIVGRLPGAFKHPSLGYVDALVMYQTL